MSDQTPPPDHAADVPLPEQWPASSDDFLQRVVAVAGLNRHDQLMRLRSHVAAELKRTHPGANESDLKSVFVARQRRTFMDAASWSEAVAAYRSWWESQRELIQRTNSARLKKREETS